MGGGTVFGRSGAESKFEFPIVAFGGSIDVKASFLSHHVAATIFCQMAGQVGAIGLLFSLTHVVWVCSPNTRMCLKNKL